MNFLDYLPYRVSFYGPDLSLQYTNGKSDGTLFSEADDTLAEWIFSDLKESENHRLDFQIPVEAFNRLLMQTYQLLFDQDGSIIGILEVVQDLNPLLSSYLDNSAQALVGWSDVTSGASIKGDED